MSDEERRLVRTEGERQLVVAKESSQSRVQVLDEERYVSAIDKIIERDFFPQLVQLRQLNLLKPLSNPSDLEDVDVSNLSLDQFFRKFTSEDNHSFQELVERAEKLKQQKLKWLFNDKEIPKKIEFMKTDEKLVEFGNGSETMVKLERKAKGTNSWAYQAKNSLMYVPDHHDSLQLSESYLRSQPKSIDYSNTHLPYNLFEPKFQADTPDTFSTTSALHPNTRLIENTPAINPTDLREQPLTWGTIDSTPLPIPSTTPGRQFRLAEPSKKEILSTKLAEKARQSIRQRHLAHTPRKLNSTPSLGNLTPAAQRLIRSKGTASNSKLGKMVQRGNGFHTPTGEVKKEVEKKLGLPSLTPNLDKFIKKK